MAKNTKTPAMVLQELSVKKNYAPPTYEIVRSISGTHENRFDYQVTVAGIVAAGTGTSKQISKHNAAHNALMILKELGIYDPSENPVQEFQVPLQQNAPESPYKSLNCIGPLKDLCLEHKIPDPIFTLLSDVGPAHSREFTFECCVSSIKTLATGNTKKMAKQLAANEMLERIKDILPDIAIHVDAKDDQKSITDENNQALKTYNEFFGNIIPDKSVKIGDYSGTLAKLMRDNCLSFDDFADEFCERTEEALHLILHKLGLACNFYQLQSNPVIMSLSLNTDTPFTTLGVSDTPEKAKTDSIRSAFEIMELFMQL